MIDRYMPQDLAEIWSEENMFRTWLRVELEVCRVLAEKGWIPKESLETIEKKADFSVERIKEIESVTHHDLVAFTTNVAEHVGPDSRYIHWGLTSTDVVDTARGLQLKQARGAKKHTEYPHLTLAIHWDRVRVITIVPNKVKPQFRRNLIGLGRDDFINVVLQTEQRLQSALHNARDARPLLRLEQRHYARLGSLGVVDGRIECDLRTAVLPERKRRKNDQTVKYQPEWVRFAFDALAGKRSNMELAVGADFLHRCPVLHSAKATDYIAATWLACQPMLRALLGDEFGKKRSRG